MAQAGTNPPTGSSYEELATALVAQLERDRQDLAKRRLEVKAATEELEKKKLELEEIERRIFGIADGVEDVVELNIGGTPISTSRAVLCSVSGSLLSGLFSGNFERGQKRDRDGKVFLDVDPAIFTKVINHLRLRRIASPECPAPLPQVPLEMRAEYDMLIRYYGLDGCMAEEKSFNIFETLAEQAGVDQKELQTNGLVNIKISIPGGIYCHTPEQQEKILGRDGILTNDGVENVFGRRPSTIHIRFLKHCVRVDAMELRTTKSRLTTPHPRSQISNQWSFQHGSCVSNMQHVFSASSAATGRMEIPTLRSAPPVDEVLWTFPGDFSLQQIVLHGRVLAK
jgi:hypothetical protein